MYAKRNSYQTHYDSVQVVTCQKEHLKFSRFTVKTPVSDFYVTEHQAPHSKSPSIRVRNDIYMLLNQKRLDKMTLQAFADYMSSYSQRSDTLSALREKVSDEDLLNFCKSRYLQTPSELLAWSQYLEAQYPNVQVPQDPQDPKDPQNTPQVAPNGGSPTE